MPLSALDFSIMHHSLGCGAIPIYMYMYIYIYINYYGICACFDVFHCRSKWLDLCSGFSYFSFFELSLHSPRSFQRF